MQLQDTQDHQHLEELRKQTNKLEKNNQKKKEKGGKYKQQVKKSSSP